MLGCAEVFFLVATLVLGIVGSSFSASAVLSTSASGPSDLNQDGIVNGEDIGILLGQWGPCEEIPSVADDSSREARVSRGSHSSGTGNQNPEINHEIETTGTENHISERIVEAEAVSEEKPSSLEARNRQQIVLPEIQGISIITDDAFASPVESSSNSGGSSEENVVIVIGEAPESGSGCLGDLNGDGVVDSFDMDVLLDDWTFNPEEPTNETENNVTLLESVAPEQIIIDNGGKCTSDYSCTEWSVCTDNQQTRTCALDRYNCIPRTEKPIELQACSSQEQVPVEEPTTLISRITGAVIGANQRTGGFLIPVIFIALIGGAAVALGVWRRRR